METYFRCERRPKARFSHSGSESIAAAPPPEPWKCKEPIVRFVHNVFFLEIYSTTSCLPAAQVRRLTNPSRHTGRPITIPSPASGRVTPLWALRLRAGRASDCRGPTRPEPCAPGWWSRSESGESATARSALDKSKSFPPHLARCGFVKHQLVGHGQRRPRPEESNFNSQFSNLVRDARRPSSLAPDQCPAVMISYICADKPSFSFSFI